MSSKSRLPRVIKIVLLEFLFFLSVFTIFVLKINDSNDELITKDTKLIESYIQRNFTEYMFVLDSLRTFYLINEDSEMSTEKLNRFISEEDISRLGIEFIQISPGNITEFVYPDVLLEEYDGKDIADTTPAYLLGMYYDSVSRDKVLMTKSIEQFMGKDVVVFTVPIISEYKDGIISVYFSTTYYMI